MIDIWLTHWSRVTHICVSKLTIIGSDNGVAPGRRQAIIWTSAGILLIQTLGTNFNENLRWNSCIFIQETMYWKMLSAKWCPICLGLNVFKVIIQCMFKYIIEWIMRLQWFDKNLLCRPNPGFKEQLLLFESMGNQLDKQNEQYKLYRLNNLALQIQSGRLNW